MRAQEINNMTNSNENTEVENGTETASPVECLVMTDIESAAKDLFDNRLGWSDGRQPYAPVSFWRKLGISLYGEEDSRVNDLRS